MKTDKVKKLGLAFSIMACFMIAFSMPVMAQEAGADDAITGAVDSFLALGAVTLLVIGGVMYMVPRIFTDMTPTMKKGFTFGAVIFVVGGIFAGLGVGLDITGDNDELPPPTTTEWASTIADNSNYVVWIDEHTADWAVSYNTSANDITAATDDCVFTVNVGRVDTSADWAYGLLEVGTIGGITDVDTGIEYPLIKIGTDGLYEADITDSDGNTYNIACTLPSSEVRADWANITVTLNAAAFDDSVLTVGQGASFVVSFAGESWTINCRCAVQSATAGSV